MIRLIIITTLVLAIACITPAWCDSALSSLGYGLPQPAANARSAGMGMVSLGMPDTLGLNLLSPASWSGSATTRFGFGGNFSSMYLEDVFGGDASDQAGLTGIGMAIPIGKDRFVGFTVSPYTRMQYEWEVRSSTDLGASTIGQHGIGGFSQIMAALSTPVWDGVRLGLAVRPIIGKVDRHWREKYDDTAVKSAGVSVSDRFQGIGWALSCQWNQPEAWTVGMSLFGPTSAGIERQTVIFSDGYAQYDQKEEPSERYDLPWDFTIGIGRWIGRHRTGFEAQWQGWDGVEKPAVLTDDFTDALRLGVGWEWAPEYRPLDPLWRIFTFRGGLYTQDHYAVNVTGHQARRIALTGGISIPYYTGKSRIDIAIEIGWMGDKDLDKIAERTIGFTFGFNHSEKWFVGRRKRN
ncbi:MAG: hypothetical protein P9X24_08940 [Candidatus Hatepunaea meridiana]|nr:hypothetical protein [Candidatus Hatepunaea meridiana]